MKLQHADSIQTSLADNSDTWREKWIDQHTSLERYILGWNITSSLSQRLGIDSGSWLGKTLVFTFILFIYLGFPLLVTLAMDQWAFAPVITWAVIATIFGITFLSYDIYSSIGNGVCSISHSVLDEEAMRRQTVWDRSWFSIRVAGVVGVVTASAILLSISQLSKQSPSMFIPAGTFIVIGFLSYQIGEIACNNFLICFEARNFSNMNHELYRFNPLDTFSLQEAIRGYNLFGLMTSLVMTVYIASSALLLPSLMYLRNPVWLGTVLTVYLITMISVVVPRIYVQKIVRDFKKKELLPLRLRLNEIFDRIQDLSPEEFSEMSRLEIVQEKIQLSPDSSLPLSTIGRVFGTLFLPSLTFVLAVAGEVYLTTLLESLFG